MRGFMKRMLKLGFLAGVGYAAWRYFERQRSASSVDWEPQPFPYPPQPRAESTTVSADDQAWVEAADGTCPVTHPVKAKLSSKIFHLPGGLNYDRTKADRCYRDPAAAEADGLRKAAR